MADQEAPAPTGSTGRLRRRDVIIRLLGLATVAVVLWLLFTRLVAWSGVVAALRGLGAGDWLLLTAVALLRIAVEPLLLMASTPRLRWPKALPAYLAPAAAASVVPGPSDLAARYAMFRSWGYSGAQTSASVLLVFLYGTFAKLALPAAAFGLLLLFGRSNAQLTTVALIASGAFVSGVIIMALLLRSEATARRLGHAVGVASRRIASWFRITTPESLAADLADRAAHFRDRTGAVVRARTHLAASAATIGQFALFAILLVSVRIVGIESGRLDWVAVFAAFALVQVLTSVPITPSGLGVAEAGYVAFLTALGSADVAEEAAAAAIVFRAFSWIIVIPLGGMAWIWWSRVRARSGRRRTN